MEATTSTRLKVGLFVVIGVFITMVSIFMIGGESSMFRAQIRLNAVFDQVQGLAAGSVVSLSGVNIGNIETIKFLPDSNRLNVVMTVDRELVQRVTKGSTVEIRTQGALGDKYIYVIPGDPKAPPLADGDVLEAAPATDLLGIFAERGQETEKVFDIINSVDRLTRKLADDQRLDRLIGNLSEASSHLRVASANAEKFSNELGATSGAKIAGSLDRIDRVLTKIDEGRGTLGALVNDPTLHEQLKSLLGTSSRRQHLKSMIRTTIERSEDSPTR